jgi:hypothetical protein
MVEGLGPAAQQEQCLTAVGVVPPAGQAGTCLLTNDGVPTEDPATQLLLFFGVPASTHIRYTVPGLEG